MTDYRKKILPLRASLKKVMHSDAIALRRELDRLVRARKKTAEGAFERRLTGLAARIQKSVQKREHRRERVPRYADLSHLPITAAKTAIVESIRNHPVTIISGETGSGKTT